MIKNNNIPFIVINVTLSILGVIALYFVSLFWLGDKNAYYELVKNSFWRFFSSRLLFNFAASIVIIVIAGIINRLAKLITFNKDIEISKILAIEFLIFTVSSVVFICLQALG
jgi:hypothetical protein